MTKNYFSPKTSEMFVACISITQSTQAAGDAPKPTPQPGDPIAPARKIYV